MVAANADFGSGASHSFCVTNNSINEAKMLSTFIYPNPADENLKISVKNSSKDYINILIYDINGKLILQNKYDLRDQNGISIKALSPGYYLLKITEGQNVLWLRFIKN